MVEIVESVRREANRIIEHANACQVGDGRAERRAVVQGQLAALRRVCAGAASPECARLTEALTLRLCKLSEGRIACEITPSEIRPPDG